MSIITEFHADGKRFKVITYNWSFNQTVDATGRPSATPQGGIMKVLVETEQDEPFTEWAISPTMMKNVKLVQRSVNFDGKSRIIELVDVYCIEATDNYSSSGSKNLSTFLVLSPAQILVNGEKKMEKHWKVTDLDARNIAPTIIERDTEEPQVIDYYLTDLNEKRIDKAMVDDKILLNIQTKNLIGKLLTISLEDKTVDFKYKGQILKNDTLKNYEITEIHEKIELEVIEQQN